jgi:hypothetical protein
MKFSTTLWSKHDLTSKHADLTRKKMGMSTIKNGGSNNNIDVFLSNKQLPFNQQKCGLFQETCG